MTQEKICRASDNFALIHPIIMKAIFDANKGYAPSYGSDSWSEEAQQLIKDVFKSKCKALFVPIGTGANVLALKLSCRRHESVNCTDIAHIQYQEYGAAEPIVGCKLLTMAHV